MKGEIMERLKSFFTTGICRWLSTKFDKIFCWAVPTASKATIRFCRATSAAFLMSLAIWAMGILPQDDLIQGLVHLILSLITIFAVYRRDLSEVISDLDRYYGLCKKLWRQVAQTEDGAYRLSNFLLGHDVPMPIAERYLGPAIRKLEGLSEAAWTAMSDRDKKSLMVKHLPSLHNWDLVCSSGGRAGDNWVNGTAFAQDVVTEARLQGRDSAGFLALFESRLKALGNQCFEVVENAGSDRGNGHFVVTVKPDQPLPFVLGFSYPEIKTMLGWYQHLAEVRQSRDADGKLVREEIRHTAFRLSISPQYAKGEDLMALHRRLCMDVPELNRRQGASGFPGYIVFESGPLLEEDVTRIEKAVWDVLYYWDQEHGFLKPAKANEPDAELAD